MLGRTTFSQHEAIDHLAVQMEFGDCFEFTPNIIRPNFSPVPDASRPRFSLTGIFCWESAEVRMQLQEMEVSSRKPELTVRRCDILAPMKRGDWLRRTLTGEMFEITETSPDSMSGVKIHLVMLGIQ